jgi:rhamnosyltransferase
MRIGALVVIYNPQKENIDNIVNYAKQCDATIVFDNSSVSNWEKVRTLSQKHGVKIEYRHNRKNLGLPVCFNRGIEWAIRSDCDWLITMDQDSIVPEGMVISLLALPKIGPNTMIVSPSHGDRMSGSPDIIEDEIVYTSGNLLNVRLLGKHPSIRFDDRLFIDRVDDEFCMRVLDSGFHIIKSTKIKMSHVLGENGKYMFGKYISNHNPLRRYYITRNSLVVWCRYAKSVHRSVRNMAWNEMACICKDMILVILFEKQKAKKVFSAILGIMDSVAGRWGRRRI